MKRKWLYYDGWHLLPLKWLAMVQRKLDRKSSSRTRKRRAELARR